MKNIFSRHIEGNKLTEEKESVAGIVIHNDYGTRTPSQYLKWLYAREADGTYVNGWAAIYINKDECLWYHPTNFVEWHCANAYANYNLIGIEVVQSHPDAGLTDKEFMENEEAAFKVAAEILKSYKLKVNRDTVNLHREYFATACPHRSWDIHVGKNAPNTRANQVKLLDYFIKRIQHYYDLIGVKKTTKKAAVKKKAFKSTVAKKPAIKKAVNNIYTVKSGDSLYTIAQAHNMTYQQLMKINDLDDYLIKVGDKLKLKSTTAVKKSVVKKAPSEKRIALKTKTEMIEFAKESVGEYFDYDGAFKFQCFDWANAYWHQMFKHGFTGMQAANIPQNNKAVLLKESKVYEFGGDVKMQAGDVVIWDWNPDSTEDFGHVAVALKVGTNGMTIVEQNADGYADKPASKRTCNFNGVEWFIRPNYKAE